MDKKTLIGIAIVIIALAGLVAVGHAGFTALPSVIDAPSLVNIHDGTQINSKDTSVKISADKQEFTANGITASAVLNIGGKSVDKATAVSTKDGNALLFTHPDGSEFKYEYGGDYLKESITLKEPKQITFALSSTAFSSAYLNEDGTIVIKSLLGQDAIYILKPYVIDSGGERIDIKYTLKDGVVGFNTDFKAFKYPIVIDPTFSRLSPTNATMGGLAISISYNETYIARASGDSPYLDVLKYNASSTSNWTQLPAPQILVPPGISTDAGIDLSPDGKYMAFGYYASPRLSIYAYNASSTSNWTLLPNISSAVAGTVYGLSFSRDSQYLAIAHDSPPRITVFKYNISSTANWTKLASPTAQPGWSANHVAFSNNSKQMGVVCGVNSGSSPLILYNYTPAISANWTAIPNPDIVPGSFDTHAIDYSDDGKYMVIGTPSPPYLYIYGYNASHLSNWTLLPNVTPLGKEIKDVTFAPGSKYFVVCTNSTTAAFPSVIVYQYNQSSLSNWSQMPNLTYIPPNARSVAVSTNYTAVGVYNTPYLVVYKTTPAPPVASFTTNTTTTTAPGQIIFTDTSTNTTTSWLWQFGDGTANETTQNSTHLFTSSGTYQVNLTVTNADGSNKSGNTQISAVELPVATFYTNISAGYPSFDVSFNDSSTSNPAMWNWSFGDGTSNATTRNVTHTYNKWIGNSSTSYNTTLSVGNVVGNNTTMVFNNITAYPLTSTMTSNVSSGKPPLVVQFNTTFGNGTATNWDWNFGDGNTSTTRNATNTFYTVGTFPVTLNASNAYSYKWQTNATMITINALTPPTADFTANDTTTYPGYYIQFNDTSTNTPTSWQWSWGDLTANSTLQNPTHSYSAIGTYTVTLTATNTDGSDTEQKVNYITVSTEPTPPTAAFSGTLNRTNIPALATFTDASTNSPTSWYWMFGDGGTSTLQNPTHIYSTAGTWDVKLQATNGDGSDWENKTGYLTTAVLAPAATFTGTPTSGNANLTVYFTDGTSNIPTSWIWQFGDGSANSTLQNPSHVYSVAGTYSVNLTATNANASSSFQRVGYITVLPPVYPHRVAASQTVAPVDTSAYVALKSALGGNHTPDNETDAVSLNWTGIVEATAMPFTTPMGVLAWFVLLAIPFLMIWIVQGKAWVPLILGVILGSTLVGFGWIPAEYTGPILAFIALSIGGIVYVLYTKER